MREVGVDTPMEIGGIDVDLKYTCNFEKALYLAASAVLAVWPDGVIEDSDTSKVLALNDLIGGGKQEVFVFRDRSAMASWTENGWTPGNANLMVHLLTFPNGYFTCVVEDPHEPELQRIITDVQSAITRKN